MNLTFETRLIRYNTMVALLRVLLHTSQIDVCDFIKSEAILAEKYGLPSNSIFRQIT